MDQKDLELYNEEQRQILLDTKEAISELVKAFNELKEATTQVKGEVEITNQRESVDLSNIDDLLAGLTAQADTITKAIEKNAHKPLEKVKISNPVKEITILNPVSDISLKDLPALKKQFSELKEAIKDAQAIVNVTKEDVKFPNTAKDYVSVRLTNGKQFYEAISKALASFNTNGLATNEKLDQVISAVNSSGSVGLVPGTDFDYIDGQQTSATVDTYVYKLGGASGTTVQTTVLTYTDSTKNNIDSVSYE